jgi:hypothetical protein
MLGDCEQERCSTDLLRGGQGFVLLMWFPLDLQFFDEARGVPLRRRRSLTRRA